MQQRRQSDLKSGGSCIRLKTILIFLANFRKMLIFSGNFTKEFRFFQATYFVSFREISILSSNFTKKFDFPGKNWSFTANSCKLFYFSSKITTSKHTSCTCYDIIIFHDPSTTPCGPTTFPAQNLEVAIPPTL